MKKQLLLITLLVAFAIEAQIRQVKDINVGVSSSNISQFTEYNGKLYFRADNGINGLELWETDGTTVGTQLIDINTGAGSSTPSRLTVANNLLFFSARDITPGSQLFVSDGTTVTKLTTTLFNAPIELFGTATNLYFVGRDDVIVGSELWKSNGTVAGTSMVVDLTPGGGQNSEVCCMEEFNNKVYFRAIENPSGSPSSGLELFSSDGTSAGTQLVVDINAGTAHGDPSGLFVFNNKLFFSAQHPSFGREMFSVTTTGTLGLLKDVTVGTTGGSPIEVKVHNGNIYFSATNGVNQNGRELWISNGFPNGTQMLKDINVATNGFIDSDPKRLTSVGTDLFFVAVDHPNVSGYELWKTDGTNAGTVLVKDIIVGNGSSDPKNLIEYNGRLYFTAQNLTNTRELWVSDGTTAGTQLVSNLEMAGTEMVVYNNELYFYAVDQSSGFGGELYAYQDPALSVNNFEENQFILHPNPVNDTFKINTNVQIKSVEIININGQLIKSFNKGLVNYTIESLSAGIYFIKIHSNKGTIIKKIMKE